MTELITKYPQVFSDKLCRCSVGVHKIKLKEGSQLQQAYAYKVPVAMRKEVEGQVAELLEWGLIYPVESPHASPIVCVPKWDGAIRIRCGNRQLHEITEPEAFSMRLPTDLIHEVARAQHILASHA